MKIYNVIIPNFASKQLEFDTKIGPFPTTMHSNTIISNLSIDSPLFYNLDRDITRLMHANSSIIISCLRQAFETQNKNAIFLSNYDLGMSRYLGLKFCLEDIAKYIEFLKTINEGPDQEYLDIMAPLYNINLNEPDKMFNITFPLTYENILEHVIQEYGNEFFRD